jgi:hypothetical protein
MKRDADKKAIGIWLECYNKLNGASFQVESYPDESDRSTESIDALCRDSGGKALGLEHTRVEAFPGEMTDNARFMEVLGRFEKDSTLAEVGVQTSASIEVGAVPKGISWRTLGSDLGVFLKQNVPGLGTGSHSLMFVQGSVSIPLRIEKRVYLPGQAGAFLAARQWPGKSNEPTMRKAFSEKLPKLKASTADRKILLLEQNSVAGAVSSDVAKHLASNGLPVWMPDEIWLLWTAALETEKYMHLARLHPDMNELKADWADGKITSKYP